MVKSVKVVLDMQMDKDYADKFKIPSVTIVHASKYAADDIANGELMKLLSNSGVDVLLTCDTNIFYQQSHAVLPLPVVSIFSHRTGVKHLTHYVPEISSLLVSSLEKRFYCAGIENSKRKKQEQFLIEKYGTLYPKDSVYHNKRKGIDFGI